VASKGDLRRKASCLADIKVFLVKYQKLFYLLVLGAWGLILTKKWDNILPFPFTCGKLNEKS
jgi:hypothetical protein